MAQIVLLLSVVMSANSLDFLTAEATTKSQPEPKLYTSRHFRIVTDMTAQDAKKLLEDLEKMYVQLVIYFKNPTVKPIPGYVVRDLNKFREIPPDARERVSAGGGLTKSVTVGKRFGNVFKPTDAEATFFATASNNVVLHEAVHAFCSLSYGRTGPVWFAEGVAEMGQYWSGTTETVNAPEHVLKYLQSGPARSISEIATESDLDPGDWRDYAWRWAVCHLLAHHPTYQSKFQSLGLAYLKGEDVTFDSVFGADMETIEFEFRFFIKHMVKGYRVDACAWEWDKAAKLVPGRIRKPQVSANRGWQASQAIVSKGTKYKVSSSGRWRVTKGGKSVSADGIDGQGVLTGVVLGDEGMMSSTFPLGSSSEFVAPSTGHLYLRCRDDWGELADNSGKVRVTIRSLSR